MERAPGETALIDRTGRMLKMEPLATVESLEQYLLKMVGKLFCFISSIILYLLSCIPIGIGEKIITLSPLFP